MTREICKCCGQVNAVGFAVPESVWRESVPEQLQESVVCLVCFSRWADEARVEWDADIVFHPVSRVTHERLP